MHWSRFESVETLKSLWKNYTVAGGILSSSPPAPPSASACAVSSLSKLLANGRFLNWRRSLFFCSAVLLRRMSPEIVGWIFSNYCRRQFCLKFVWNFVNLLKLQPAAWMPTVLLSCCIDTTPTSAGTKVTAIVIGILNIVAIIIHNQQLHHQHLL